jgi:hypothetical protein
LIYHPNSLATQSMNSKLTDKLKYCAIT